MLAIPSYLSGPDMGKICTDPSMLSRYIGVSFSFLLGSGPTNCPFMAFRHFTVVSNFREVFPYACFVLHHIANYSRYAHS